MGSIKACPYIKGLKRYRIICYNIKYIVNKIYERKNRI